MRSARTGPGESQTESGGAAPSHALLLATSAERANAISEALGQTRWLVHTASDESSASSILSAARVDLILLDIDPQSKDTTTLLGKLHKHRPDLPAIALVEECHPQDVVDALRERVCDILVRPFSAEELAGAAEAALTSCAAMRIEVVSSSREWVELRVPCDIGAVSLLEKTLVQIEDRLPEALRQALAYAFREMLSNAVEYGCNLDRNQRVEVRYVRLKRAIVCWIKDPGLGFDPNQLAHAAISNPAADPIHHLSVRNDRGLRAGGFGILMTRQMVDELVYNEAHNELMFVKYLDSNDLSPA